MNIIEIKNLTKNYGKHRGIVDINLKVEEGDIFGFIGPNGAGKSTTIRTMLGLIAPSSGEAKLLGKKCSIGNKEILKDIGYMPSEMWFYPNMKVGEIIKLSSKLQRKDCSQEANILCERLELDIKKKIDELSLGNRKKVGIVCAMQHKPKLYILDEPTSGLDPLMQKEFWNILKERNEEGATVFLSSHVLSEVQRHCNNAAIIREGRLIVSDSVATLSKTSARRVSLHGINSIENFAGVRDIVRHDDSVNFLYQGDIKQLISYVNNLDINDMTITEPDLEEMFLHYYEKEGE